MDRSLLIFLASGLAMRDLLQGAWLAPSTASTAISKAWLVGKGGTVGGGYWVWSGRARGLVWSGLVWSAGLCFIPPPTVLSDKSQELSVFHGRQKLTSAMKQRPEKSW